MNGLTPAMEDEKLSSLARQAGFMKREMKDAPAVLERLRAAALSGGKIFTELCIPCAAFLPDAR